MQIAAKMIVAGVFSLLIGVAFASPLLVSDLNIKPWIRHTQGPTAEFYVDVVYANFTVLNETEPTLAYQIVFNITNLADIGAKLMHINFAAAEKITNLTGNPFPTNGNWSGWGGGGWEAEGAWVDGKWYNVSWVNGTWPNFDRNGNIVEGPQPYILPFQREGYWMEGVQLYERHANGTLLGIYLNMNGTWTEITGRTNVTLPISGGFSLSNSVVQEFHVFQDILVDNTNSTMTAHNGTKVATKMFLYTQTGEGYFDNYWEPHESRLIMLQGTTDSLYPRRITNEKALEVLKSGAIYLKTETLNRADRQLAVVNNTIEDTWSSKTELKQVQLSEYGDNYIYNNILDNNHIFQPDQWGVEVFVKPRN